MYKIQIILGSTRPQRTSEVVGKWIAEEAKKVADLEVELLDLRNYPMPFFDEVASPVALKGQYTNDVVKKWVSKVGEADGYIIIAPEYNHGYPAVLKNALDYPFYEWNKKPVAFVSYGGMGGARSVEQLRQVVNNLDMVPVLNAIQIQGVWTAFDEQGKPKDQNLVTRAADFFKELMWWTKALKNARQGM